jgi:replicative DNA helicase
MSSQKVIYSREAEEALIGALVIDPRLINEVDIEIDDLHDAKAKLVLTALRALQERGEIEDANALSIAEELMRIEGGAQVGGLFALTEYATRCPQTYDLNAYSTIIREHAGRRRLVDMAGKLATAAYAPSADIEAVTASVLDGLVKNGRTSSGAVSVKEVAGRLFDEVEAAQKNPTDYFGIPTGMAGFDKITSGMQRGEVTMLAGEPGVGKSSLAMQLCAGMALGVYGRRGTPGAVYQLEMTSLATWRRLVALKARVSSKSMRAGRLTDEEMTRFVEAQAALSDLPIFISDRTDWTTLGLRSDLARLKAEHDIGWVLIDYMGLLKDEPHLDSTERSALVSDRVHDLAKDFNVSVLAVHDMTKAGVTGAVQGQAGLAGSRRVMYNADSIIFIKPVEGSAEDFKLEWAKFREDSADRYLSLRRISGQAAFTEV